jgi:hypothetical protein
MCCSLVNTVWSLVYYTVIVVSVFSATSFLMGSSSVIQCDAKHCRVEFANLPNTFAFAARRMCATFHSYELCAYTGANNIGAELMHKPKPLSWFFK